MTLTCNHREGYFTTHTVTWQFALEGNRLLISARHKRSQLDSQDPPLKGLFCYYNVVQWGSESSWIHFIYSPKQEISNFTLNDPKMWSLRRSDHCSSFSHDNTLLIISAVDFWEQRSLAGMTITWARDRITDICPECLEMQLLDTSGPPLGQKDEANTDVPKLHVANFQLDVGSKSQLFATDSHFKRTNSRAEINMFTACWCKKKQRKRNGLVSIALSLLHNN